MPNYEETLIWSDEDNGSQSSSKLFAVSENTSKVLKESFLKGIPNPYRRQMRERFGDPKCPPTRVPKLDKMVKDSIPRISKARQSAGKTPGVVPGCCGAVGDYP